MFHLLPLDMIELDEALRNFSLFNTLSIVSAVAGILAFAIRGDTQAKRVRLVYGLTIVLLATGVAHLEVRLKRFNDVNRKATELIHSRSSTLKDAVFIQAALSFLERNRDLYPDAYARATEQAARLHGSASDAAWSTPTVAQELHGILHGIADVSEVR